MAPFQEEMNPKNNHWQIINRIRRFVLNNMYKKTQPNGCEIWSLLKLIKLNKLIKKMSVVHSVVFEKFQKKKKTKLKKN